MNQNFKEFSKQLADGIIKPEPSIETLDTPLDTLLKKHKISADEYQKCLEIISRVPSFSELGVFSSMWSEHCSYKSSRFHLKRFFTEGEQVVVGPGENAGVVRLHKNLCAAFKMESHNHPSYVEPYQGAATGVGGILRDVFCMGARPIANMNSLRFGSKDHPRTAYLESEVVKGIGDYGNCIGVPTVGGTLAHHPSYDGNCLVNAMNVGLIREEEIFKGYASGIGNLVVYIGSATGRDGIHGATMASDSFSSQTQDEDRSAIQVGDPFAEKRLLEATLEALANDMVVGLQDMGAAGLTSSSFEMADRAQNGLFLNLDAVPTRAANMTAYELLLSESQERMLLVIEPSKTDELQKLCEKWQLDYAIIGEVTDTKRVQAVKDNILCVDLPVAELAEQAPLYQRPMTDTPQTNTEPKKNFDLSLSDIKNAILQTYKEKPLTPKKLYEQYDRHVGTRSVFDSQHDGAALLWLRGETQELPYLGVAIANSCSEKYGAIDSHQAGIQAICRSARSIAATGATPLATTDCLNYGNPEIPSVMRSFSDSVDGMSAACKALNVPVVSGNVSLYNETDGKSILPTPMIGMIGKIEDVRRARAASFYERTNDNIDIYLLRPKKRRFWIEAPRHQLLAKDANALAAMDPCNLGMEREALDILTLWQPEDKSYCRDVGEGGVLVTLLKMIARHGHYTASFHDDELSADHLCFNQTEFLVASHQDSAIEQLQKIVDRYPQFCLEKIAELKPGQTSGVLLEIGSEKIYCKDLGEEIL